MPRELTELVGQPLGWDMMKLTQADESETLIEHAIAITDLCTLHDSVGKRQVLLCFFKDQKHGPCVASLDILDLEEYILSEEVGLAITRIQDIKDQTELGKIFLDRLHRLYKVDTIEIHNVIIRTKGS